MYRDLSVQKKEDMLSQIALTTFEKGDYFIKQRQLEEYICGYIRNTANAKTDDDELHLDSEVVLKSIEAQHGLFVERARGIYSFSHLTFHEYFAARQLMLSTTPSKLESALQKLITHITDKQWREVILLSVCMAREADELLLLMKREIDNLLADNDNLQSFLQSINQQSRSVAKSPYSLATTRAYYFDLNLARSIDANLDKDITRTLELENILAVAIDLDQSLDIAVHIDYILDRSIVLDEENSTNKEISRYKSDFQFLLHYRRLYTDLSLARIRRCYRIDRDFLYFNPTNDVDRILYHILEKDKSIYESLGDINGVHQIANDEITYDHIRTLTNEFSQDLASKVFNIKGVIHDRLNPRLQNLKDNFPDPIDWRAFTEWWKANGREWISELRKVLAEYSKSGYKWQLTKKQKYLLNQYSEANKLLVECLKSDCYVSRETRREIEDNLLFPIKK